MSTPPSTPAATSPQCCSPKSPSAPDPTPSAPVPRRVDDGDTLSRHIYAPKMIGAADEFFWAEIFQFPAAYDRTESVVWRKVVPNDVDVHAMGCDKQASDRAKGRMASTYRGFTDSSAGVVRAKATTRGHGVAVVHAPEEGDWHVHLQVVLAPGIADLSKGDKSDIRGIMSEAFGPLRPHSCP